MTELQKSISKHFWASYYPHWALETDFPTVRSTSCWSGALENSITEPYFYGGKFNERV